MSPSPSEHSSVPAPAGKNIFLENFHSLPLPPVREDDTLKILNPFQSPETRKTARLFYEKYYADSQPRNLILGINPGRLGAGLTGIGFTDPIRLETICGIPNTFEKKQELSSLFIYDVIRSWGGARKFFSLFLIDSLIPYGFTDKGKNKNYYDFKGYAALFENYVFQTLSLRLRRPTVPERVLCLGKKNYHCLKMWNKKFNLFSEIFCLPHPRWIMQYRYKERALFREEYLSVLRTFSNKTRSLRDQEK